MSKAINNKTAETINAAKTTVKDTIVTNTENYAVNAMRTAIIEQSRQGINHAITKEEALKSGATEERWTQWGIWVDDLRAACVHYAELQADRNTPENSKLMKSAEGKVWAQWRSILKVGEENLFHKNMFLRRSDVEKLTTFAGNITYVFVPGKGKIPAVTGKTNFRKLVETFLACRIAGNSILSDAQRDVIKGYVGAQNTIKKMGELLDGTADNQGLTAKLAAKQSEYDAIMDALKQAKVAPQQIETISAPAKLAVDLAKADVAAAEKAIKDAEKRQAELKEEYQKIVDLLDEIENPAE